MTARTLLVPRFLLHHARALVLVSCLALAPHLVPRVLAATDGTDPIEAITIQTIDDSVSTYVKVEPRSGFVRGTRANGETEFLPTHRIRAIRGPGDLDLTKRVLVDGRKVSESDLAQLIRDQVVREPPEIKPWGPRQPRDLSFLARSYPDARWFVVFQYGMLATIDNDDASRLVLDWGFMRNLGPHWALGVSVHHRLGEAGGTGVVLRGRRWVSRSISVDLATGPFHPQTSSPYDPGGNIPGWIGQAHLNLGAASVRLEVERWKDDYSKGYYPEASDKVETGTRWRMGGTLSHVPGLVALLIITPVVASVVNAE